MPGMLQTGGAIDERLRDEIVRKVATGTLRIRDACARYQVSQQAIVGWVAAFRVGVPAVHRVLALERGSVVATLKAVTRPRTVHISTMALLLDGLRRSDEYRDARSRLGPGLYRLSSKGSSAGVSLSEQKFEPFRHFDVPSRILSTSAPALPACEPVE